MPLVINDFIVRVLDGSKVCSSCYVAGCDRKPNEKNISYASVAIERTFSTFFSTRNVELSSLADLERNYVVRFVVRERISRNYSKSLINDRH